MDIKECYEILGITKKATDEQVKKAYREKSKQFHPNLHWDDKDATAKFAKVSEAYRLILENREKKHKSIFNFGTIFSDAGSKTNTEKKKETTKSEKPESEQKGIRGSDVYTTVEITFEESILGCRKEITVQHEEICPCSKEENHTDNCTICNNTGKVLKKFIYDISIPRGIFSGQVLKIKGKGNVGINGGENGDLVINIQVKQKKGFVRTGQDVVYYMTISFPQAVLGAVINVPTAYGTVNCEIPAGIKTGEQLCLAGYSFKNCWIPKHIRRCNVGYDGISWILHNDERPNGEKHGYFCQNSYKPFGTTIINILYVKTVVGKAPGKEVYRNNNEPLFVYKNGNISFVETE